MIITIDGPAAAGKGTLSSRLAQKYKLHYNGCTPSATTKANTFSTALISPFICVITVALPPTATLCKSSSQTTLLNHRFNLYR